MATETLETTLQMHNGNGTAGPFSFTFNEYESDDIKVYVLDEDASSSDYGTYMPKTVTTHYTLDTVNNRITFTTDNYPATSTNKNIAIERRTDVTDANRRAIFQAGSSIKAADLNAQHLQSLNAVEDLWDHKISKLNPTVYGTFEFSALQKFDGRDLSVDGAKLDGIEAGAKGDLTNAEIRTAVEAATDSNVFTDADHSKLNAIEANADVTDATNVDAAGAVMNSDASTAAMSFVVDEDDLASDSATKVPTQQSVKAYIGTTNYTKTESDSKYYKKTGSPDEVIKSSETWPTDGTKDDFVVTPGSVDLRVVALVEEVGGFVAIDNETSFPNTNPDINDGAGTIVSIKSLASPFTSSGSGVATIANGTIGNSTVTINGLANSTTYGAGLGMLVETTTTLNTYKFHRSTPLAADVAAVAAKSTEVGRLGTADAVADMAILGTTDCVADMAILATTDVVADLNTLGTSDIVSDLDTVADISAKVTTVADNNTNINTVSTNIASVNTCANNISDVNNFGDLYQIGTSAPTKDGGNNDLAAGDLWFDSSSNKTLKVHNGTSFQAVSPAQSVLDDISIVSGSLSRQEDMGAITDAISSGSATGSLDTCATNITNINTFANVYRIAADAPSTSLDEGDLWYDSTANKLKYYNGSAWAVTAAAGLSSISDDTSPELGGNLDCNNKNLTEVATVSGDNLQIDFGTIA